MVNIPTQQFYFLHASFSIFQVSTEEPIRGRQNFSKLLRLQGLREFTKSKKSLLRVVWLLGDCEEYSQKL